MYSSLSAVHFSVVFTYVQRNHLTHKICLGESSVIEDGFDSDGSALKWAGGGGGGGGATYIYRVRSFFSFNFLVLNTSLKTSITAL